MSDVERCEGWALSFFANVEAARAKFVALQKSNPRVSKTLGDAIAEGHLVSDDGVMCGVDTDGHFELHEYADVELASRFTVTARLG